MGKFINPKKIKGQDKINRMKDLMDKMDTLTESKTLSELELIKKGPNNVVYGIIRENHNYFIKTTEKTSGTFLSEDFNYVGGVKNKFDERYNSYAEAIKHLNMKFDMLNESFGIEDNNSIFESDGIPTGNASGIAQGFGFVTEEDDPDHPGESCDQAHPDQSHDEYKEGPQIISDEEEVEEQKKVIKVDAPTPPPAPVEDEVEVDEFAAEDEFGGEEDFGAEEEIEGEEGEFEEEGDEYTKKIQKLTGKVTQLMRDMDEPDPELDKYVVNSVISAIDFEEMDDEDVEDIIAKIEGEEEEEFGEEGEEDFGEDEFETEEEITEDSEGEETYNYGEDEGEDEKRLKDDDLSKSHKDALKKDMEYDEDKEDRKEKGTKFQEQRKISKTYSKKQLMESFLKKNTNLALKKVLKENHRICEECMGGGCASCGGTHSDEEWAPLTEYSDREMLSGDNVEVVEQEMDVTTALATGQDYLRATGDLDRDGDDIPNRLDMDNNDDGELDYSMDNDYIDIDIDSIMGNSPDIAEPTTKPGTKPTTTPGTTPRKPRWKKIPRPNVDPRPKAKGGRRKLSSRRRGIYR